MNKGIKIAYYISTILLSISFLYGGYSELVRDEASIMAITMLGYPLYLLTILGVAKILGVIGIWQKFSPTLREWAYAGIVIDIVGAGASLIAINAGFAALIPVIVSLAVVLISYFTLRKMNALKSVDARIM